MTNISAEKLQRNMDQQATFLDLYRNELTREAYRFNIASILKYVCLHKTSFGSDSFSKLATDCLIVFLHSAALRKQAFFSPNDSESAVHSKGSKNLHRLMLENVKATMKYIDYSVLLKRALGNSDLEGMFALRDELYSKVFPEETTIDVCSQESINDSFFSIVDHENLADNPFSGYDVQNICSLDTSICELLCSNCGSLEDFEKTEYGILQSAMENLKTPFLKFSGRYYSFVTRYSLKEIRSKLEDLNVEIETYEEEQSEVEAEPNPIEVEEELEYEEPQDDELEEDEAVEEEFPWDDESDEKDEDYSYLNEVSPDEFTKEPLLLEQDEDENSESSDIYEEDDVLDEDEPDEEPSEEDMETEEDEDDPYSGSLFDDVDSDEPESEPEVELQPEPKTILDSILKSFTRENAVTQYVAELSSDQRNNLSNLMEVALKACIKDGRDKMFTIPDTTISVMVYKLSRDPMLEMQRRQNVGAMMYAEHRDSWSSLELAINENGALVKCEYEKITKSSFLDWQWKMVENLGNRILERRK